MQFTRRPRVDFNVVVRAFGGARRSQRASRIFSTRCSGRWSAPTPTRRRATDVPNRLLARGRVKPTPRWLLLGIFDWRSGLPYSVVNETLDFVGPRNNLPLSDLRAARSRRRAPVQDVQVPAVGRRARAETRSTRSCRPTCRRTSRRRRSARSTTPSTASSASRSGSSGRVVDELLPPPPTAARKHQDIQTTINAEAAEPAEISAKHGQSIHRLPTRRRRSPRAPELRSFARHQPRKTRKHETTKTDRRRDRGVRRDQHPLRTPQAQAQECQILCVLCGLRVDRRGVG